MPDALEAPLADIRVVEVASYVAVPACGALLADLGADVIKVEVPGGEVMRHATPRRSGYRSELAQAPHFHMENRGKRSLELDLGRADARAALGRVVDGADVFLTNLLPRRLARYELDAATLRAERPRLVFASLNGYGTEGPDADTPAYDYSAYWARTGLMDTQRDEGSAPAYLRPGGGDHAAALALATAILAALRVRDRSGVGQQVDVNLMHIGFYVAGNDASMVLSTGVNTPRHDRARSRNPLWNHYETRDGRWLFLVMIDSDRYWPRLAEALGRPEWARDERFASAVGRYREREDLCARIAGRIAEADLDEWEQQLASTDLIWAPVRSLREAIEDPQAQAARMFADVAHLAAPGLRTVAPPLHLSSHPMPGDRPAPELGADGERVLREAGCDDATIAAALRNDDAR